MNLCDMKCDPPPKGKASTAVPAPAADPYPWGLRIRLNGDDMKKLGITARDFSAGDTVKVEAVGRVTEISDRQTDGPGKDASGSSIEIQLREVGVEADESRAMASEFKDEKD